MNYRIMDMYCKKCNKVSKEAVLISANSIMIERDPELKKKAIEGTLFKNYCSVCGEELLSHNKK